MCDNHAMGCREEIQYKLLHKAYTVALVNIKYSSSLHLLPSPPFIFLFCSSEHSVLCVTVDQSLHVYDASAIVHLLHYPNSDRNNAMQMLLSSENCFGSGEVMDGFLCEDWKP